MTDKPVSRRVAIKPASGQRGQVDYPSALHPEHCTLFADGHEGLSLSRPVEWTG
ncbi:MAG: hypothetical protein ACHQQS_09645 [Thermoanaerobaculales bacterium]